MTPLQVATREIGVAEPEAFRRYCDDEQIYWCAAFVVWVWLHSEARPIPGNRWRNRAVWHLQHSLEAAGARVDYSLPGDIVVFRRGAGTAVDARGVLRARSTGHVGIVAGHDIDTASLLTVEGNIGDRVIEFRHAMPSPAVLAFYRWA